MEQVRPRKLQRRLAVPAADNLALAWAARDAIGAAAGGAADRALLSHPLAAGLFVPCALRRITQHFVGGLNLAEALRIALGVGVRLACCLPIGRLDLVGAG